MRYSQYSPASRRLLRHVRLLEFVGDEGRKLLLFIFYGHGGLLLARVRLSIAVNLNDLACFASQVHLRFDELLVVVCKRLLLLVVRILRFLFMLFRLW